MPNAAAAAEVVLSPLTAPLGFIMLAIIAVLLITNKTSIIPVFSIIPIIVFWKPFYLFKDGFAESYAYYWSQTIKYYVIFGLSFVIVHFLLTIIPINPGLSFGWWIVYAIICSGSFAILYLSLMTYFGPGGKNLIKRLPLYKIGLRI